MDVLMGATVLKAEVELRRVLAARANDEVIVFMCASKSKKETKDKDIIMNESEHDSLEG